LDIELSNNRGDEGRRGADVTVVIEGQRVIAMRGKTMKWAAGVDLGGTKLKVARVHEDGAIQDSTKVKTRVESGHRGIESDILDAVEMLQARAGAPPVAVGIGVAGQIGAADGTVRFSPNLSWHNVPLQADIERSLGLPTVVVNDVRAITWGEWLHGAGRGFDDIVCLFVGTGVGGGVISGGRMLSGCSNTAGELGHIVVDVDGPECTCGNRGCLEALAGGWAIARLARQLATEDAKGGERLLGLAGSLEAITAKTVALAAHDGDALSVTIVEKAAKALVAGAVGLVNAFNPSRLILGGGVISGMPRLIDRVREGVGHFALPAAATNIEVVPGVLGSDAGVIGAASLVMRTVDDRKAAKEGKS
jgi:glucokinase